MEIPSTFQLHGKLKKWLIIAGIVVAVFIGVLLLLDKVIMPAWVHSQPVVKMPDLVGKNIHDVMPDLLQKKFVIAKVDTHADERYPKDIVLYQAPYADEDVKEGRKVYLTISSGKEIMQLPNFVGMDVRDAKIKIQSMGLGVGDVMYAPSPSVPEDNVIQQTPASGSRVSLDAHVSLIVSTGPEKPTVVIPTLVGKTLGEAQTTLQSLHLVFGTITYVKNRSLLPTTIMEQQPAAGDSVKEGSPVNLTVAGEN
ncbi:MAG TPA: PASTA domain-containing protein [Candidatus Kapabacteria bacterium]|nr:PASTA domain-containing protein [Candidatus Kapabacteria bacterium]